jgi:hypothetical protein
VITSTAANFRSKREESGRSDVRYDSRDKYIWRGLNVLREKWRFWGLDNKNLHHRGHGGTQRKQELNLRMTRKILALWSLRVAKAKGIYVCALLWSEFLLRFANRAGEHGVLRLRSAMPHSAQDDRKVLGLGS